MSLLEAALRDAAVTREVAVQPGVAAALPALLARRASGRWLVVADHHTWDAAAREVQKTLVAHGLAAVPPLVLQGEPRLKPRVETAQAIAQQLRENDAQPVAVGSGVINDLVKYAASLAGKPYVCVATAASMDGYAASGAALLDGAFKRTLACPPPVAVVADPGVLAAAPAAMTAWGYGDLAGKIVAGADWLLADALGVEAIARAPFALVQDHIGQWLSRPAALAQRDPSALSDLLSGLLVSGFAMQAHGNSRPASGSDHQFSHLWEMEGLQVGGEPAAHGACVGVGCVAMLAAYEWLMAQGDDTLARIDVRDWDDAPQLDAEIRAALGEGEVAAAARAEMAAKRALGSRAARVRNFQAVWPALRERLRARLPRASEMQAKLQAVGAASHPADLGVNLSTLAADYRRARLIRRRYTLLDLLEDLDLLDIAVADLFGARGFWQGAPTTKETKA